MWAYSVNGRGGIERYMDANDLPAALAPLWGFCPPDDQALADHHPLRLRS